MTRLAARIVIVGGPRTGKTTLAAKLAHDLGCSPLCTDSVMHLGWSESSAEVATWFLQPGPWVIDGVAAVRALRKWFRLAPTLAPCDSVIYLQQPRVPQTPRQEGTAKGCATIWRDVHPLLRATGVVIQGEPPP